MSCSQRPIGKGSCHGLPESLLQGAEITRAYHLIISMYQTKCILASGAIQRRFARRKAEAFMTLHDSCSCSRSGCLCTFAL
jgi:hypothetical protein